MYLYFQLSIAQGVSCHRQSPRLPRTIRTQSRNVCSIPRGWPRPQLVHCTVCATSGEYMKRHVQCNCKQVYEANGKAQWSTIDNSTIYIDVMTNNITMYLLYIRWRPVLWVIPLIILFLVHLHTPTFITHGCIYIQLPTRGRHLAASPGRALSWSKLALWP